MKELKDYIRTVPNFPKEGVMFRDVTTLLQNPESLKKAIDSMQDNLKDTDFDAIVGAESRGFIFGAPIAYNLNKAFIPIRKKGKLPYETIEESYELEYGKATLEIHKDAIKPGQKVVIVDDLIGTGGTLEAMIKLVERLGGKVEKILCLIELPELKGREKLKGYNLETNIIFNGK